jgi:osomolarity two-component system response regulator SSK1
LQDYDDKRSTFLTTLANEIEDATVMLTSTLHYFSPSRILEGSHELLTACSIPVPIASISAINTTTKQVRYISSNLSLLARLSLAQNIVEDTIERSTVQKEFDIGELLQAVGDAMAGVAAKLDVKLVIYHSDNALHYTNVVGDEDVLRHTLMNVCNS